MVPLLAFLLLTVLLLVIEGIWRHLRSRQPSSWPTTLEPDRSLYWDPTALPRVQRRLDVLAAELQQLDEDETIFARAFRIRAAKSAYQALLDDAARLTEQAQWIDVSQVTLDAPRPVDTAITFEAASSSAPNHEILRL
jgi:hypothetical protein